MAQPDDRLLTRYHELLLRIAGWAPDDAMRSARSALAENRLTDVVQTARNAVRDKRIPIRSDDAALLARADSETPHAVSPADPTGTANGQRPDVEFTPVLPDPSTSDPLPLLLDLTGPGAPALAAADAAAVAALDGVGHPVGLWRAWRFPRSDRSPLRPVPVYLLETRGEPSTLPRAAAWLQHELERAGLVDPQVEVYGPGIELPNYQRSARGRSALLWAGSPRRPVGIARDFDSFDPVTGGRFDDDHPRLPAGGEAARVLDYLGRGSLLLATLGRQHDVVDRAAGAVVPSNFRTDGVWIWTDAVDYYLRTYALSPDAELLAHIRERKHTFVEPDAVAIHRAMAELARPS